MTSVAVRLVGSGIGTCLMGSVTSSAAAVATGAGREANSVVCRGWCGGAGAAEPLTGTCCDGLKGGAVDRVEY